MPISMSTVDPDVLADGVLAGDRAIIGRAITLVENRNPARRRQAQAMLQRLLPHTGQARRIGITGVPGVGTVSYTHLTLPTTPYV